jgi:hypothetical protein
LQSVIIHLQCETFKYKIMKADFEKGTKVCSRCKRELPISEFSKQSCKADGLTLYCTECKKERGKLKREAIKNDPVRHAKMLEAYKRYRQSEKGKEKSREQEKRRRDSSEKLKKLAEKQHKYYQEKLAHPKTPREFIINEEGKECLKCACCGRIIPKDSFYREFANPLGYAYKCKDCKFKQQHEYRQTDEYKQRISEYNKIYRQKESFKERRREYNNEKYREDINYRLGKTIRNRMGKTLRGEIKSSSSFDYTGCSIDFLRKWLENQFTEGMTWENMGEWHVDHILPCASFNLEIEENKYICFNYRNLQPLWGADNLSKRDSIPNDYEDKLNELTTLVRMDMEKSRKS